jgi:hypothetical protein
VLDDLYYIHMVRHGAMQVGGNERMLWYTQNITGCEEVLDNKGIHRI